MIDGRKWDSIYADEMSRFESIDYEALERWAKAVQQYEYGCRHRSSMDEIIEAALYWKKVANEEYGQKNLLYPNPAGSEKLDEFLGEFSTEE